jgi:RNA-directed DNA polymerase
LSPVLEADFRECSYGFQPKRGAHDAIVEIQAWVTWGYRKVIDAELKAGFDALPHEGVVAAVRRRISDPWSLRMIRRWLKAGILEEGAIRSAVAGTPQGGVIFAVARQRLIFTRSTGRGRTRRGEQGWSATATTT